MENTSLIHDLKNQNTKKQAKESIEFVVCDKKFETKEEINEIQPKAVQVQIL